MLSVYQCIAMYGIAEKMFVINVACQNLSGSCQSKVAVYQRICERLFYDSMIDINKHSVSVVSSNKINLSQLITS